ncbi:MULTISPECIES: hypothetical protein [Priestia]|uniref:hypothetical protein n=1 Tax=Priestia TaxID=2800373 RepID=UPI002FFDFFB8
MKEKELLAVTNHLEDLFSQLLKGTITKNEFTELSDELYRKQTILRYTIELEKGLTQRKVYK